MSRRVVYDIETAPNAGLYFGRNYDVFISKVIQKSFVLGFAYQVVGQKRIRKCYIWDFPLFKKEPQNDIEVIKFWRELMLRTDVIIGWNSNKFDNRVMYGRLLIHNLPPLPMPQKVDVMLQVKKLAAYDSYRLDDVSEAFGYGNKLETKIDLWWNILQGDKKAMREMETYNKRDVEITTKDYLHVMPHMLTHPNMANIDGKPDACPICGKSGTLISNGTRMSKTGRYKRYFCTNCGAAPSARTMMKGEKVKYI